MLEIELRAAPLPKPLNKIAVHLYLVVKTLEETSRWELWQTKNAFQKVSVLNKCENQKSNGHIHINLKSSLEGVGGGSTYSIAQWSNQEAVKIYQELQRSFDEYPHKNLYLPWPGPNSNTYIATVLNNAKVKTLLPPKAIGKDYHGLASFKTLPDFRCNLLTFGLSHDEESFELHALGMTFGLSKRTKKILHPLSK